LGKIESPPKNLCDEKIGFWKENIFLKKMRFNKVKPSLSGFSKLVYIDGVGSNN
jgi:hypothetical protein